jgi:serine/threonine protein kinase
MMQVDVLVVSGSLLAGEARKAQQEVLRLSQLQHPFIAEFIGVCFWSELPGWGLSLVHARYSGGAVITHAAPTCPKNEALHPLLSFTNTIASCVCAPGMLGLEEVVLQGGARSPRQYHGFFVRTARQLQEAVLYLHNKAVCHRDITPGG